MSEVWLFVAGLLITIPVATGVGGLILAALADGRENERMKAPRSSPRTD